MAATLQFVSKFDKCGKGCRNCPHGPYWKVTWWHGGKQHWKYLGKDGVTGIFEHGTTIVVFDSDLPELERLTGDQLRQHLADLVKAGGIYAEPSDLPDAMGPDDAPAPIPLPPVAFTVHDWLSSFDLGFGDRVSRELVRKKLYEYKRRCGADSEIYQTKLEAFCRLCDYFDWKRPRDQ